MARASPRRTKPRKLDFLGLTLVEPTQDLRTRADVAARYAGPFVARVKDSKRLPKRDRPPLGASFWQISFAMLAFSWRVPLLRQRHQPDPSDRAIRLARPSRLVL